MPSKIDIMIELERRGQLPADKKILLDEARNRGLINRDTTLQYDINPTTGRPDFSQMTIDANVDESQLPPEYSTGRNTWENWIKPAIEMGGMTAGGLAGSTTGPAGPLTVPLLAGAGYAGAKRLTEAGDVLLGYKESPSLGESTLKTAEDIGTGAFNEMVGQSIPPLYKGTKNVVKWPFNKLGLTKTGAATKAAEKLATTIKGTELTQPQITQNTKIAKELELEIPGLKLTYGQLTDDASTKALERSLAVHGGQDLSQAQREVANRILREYYERKVVGGGDPAEVIAQARKLHEGLTQASKSAQDAVDVETMRLERHMDEQTMGKRIWTTLFKGKQEGRAKAETLYNKIPNVKVDTTILKDTINNLESEFDPKVEKPINFPTRMIKGIRELITQKKDVGSILDQYGKTVETVSEGIKPVNFVDLRKLRSQVMSEIRTSEGSSKPNDQYIRRLEQLQQGIEDTIDTLSGRKDQAGQLYREASSYYKEYSKMFKQGTVADVLYKGHRGEDTRLALAKIAGKFYSLDGLDYFTSAIGNKDEARKAMSDYVSMDLLNSAKDPGTGKLVPGKAYTWLSKNSGKLKKLGLYDDFKNIDLMLRKTEEMSGYQDVFNKSVANDILKTDVDHMIPNVFSKSKDYAKTAQELLDIVKGNKSATAGVKKAYADYLTTASETTELSFFQQEGQTISEMAFNRSKAKLTTIINKFKNATKIIYADEPEKIKAIDNVIQVYHILGRTTKSPIGGGSDTAEHLATIGKTIDIVAGSTVPGKWYAFKTVRDWVNRFGEANTNEFLRRAIFNPDYAVTLTEIAKEGPTEETMQKAGKLMTLIMYETGITPQTISQGINRMINPNAGQEEISNVRP